MKREDKRIKDTKVVRGAEISSDHYLVLLVMKRCWREVRQKGPEEQNTLKWNVQLGERKYRKEFERKFTQKLMASRCPHGSSVEMACDLKEACPAGYSSSWEVVQRSSPTRKI